MKGQRIIFVMIIMLISVLCIGKMNMSYNRLSRYQYIESMSEEEQLLVTEKLSDEEIEYLIEWAISPREYIAFIKEPRFSIYHLEEYNQLQLYHPYLTTKQVVELVEVTCIADEEHAFYTFDELSELINSYDSDTILFWVENGDLYQPEGQLISSSKDVATVVTDIFGVSVRMPFELVSMEGIPVLDDEKEVLLHKEAKEALTNLCEAIVTDKVSSRKCGGLVVKEGYISYEEQEEIYSAALEQYGKEALDYVDLPGHSEHQLGLAVDLAVSGLRSDNFNKTKQYEWLLKRAWEFGFVQTYSADSKPETLKEERNSHWRYIGLETAKEMHEKQLTIMDLLK